MTKNIQKSETLTKDECKLTTVFCINNMINKDIEDWLEKDPNHLYIGRNIDYTVKDTLTSKWQNPFSIKKYGVDKSLDNYKKWIISGINPITGSIRSEGPLFNDILELKGKILGCWCKLDGSHGDILAKLVNTLITDSCS